MKKNIPKDAFIPMPTRVMAIIQLCLAFIVLLFILGHPFMGKHYALKSRLMVYNSVLQNQHFQAVPEPAQQQLIQAKSLIQSEMGSPFIVKATSAIQRLFSISIFKFGWVIFSIIIAILLLKKTEGAALAAYVLPLLALAYGIDNHWFGTAASISKTEQLYPSEKYLEETYLGHQLSSHFLTQRDELIEGWESFLIKEWAQEQPAQQISARASQIAKGEFAFNLERSRLLSEEPLNDSPRQKESVLILGIYVIWNLIFAFYMNRKKWNLN